MDGFVSLQGYSVEGTISYHWLGLKPLVRLDYFPWDKSGREMLAAHTPGARQWGRVGILSLQYELFDSVTTFSPLPHSCSALCLVSSRLELLWLSFPREYTSFLLPGQWWPSGCTGRGGQSWLAALFLSPFWGTWHLQFLDCSSHSEV